MKSHARNEETFVKMKAAISSRNTNSIFLRVCFSHRGNHKSTHTHTQQQKNKKNKERLTNKKKKHIEGGGQPWSLQEYGERAFEAIYIFNKKKKKKFSPFFCRTKKANHKKYTFSFFLILHRLNTWHRTWLHGLKCMGFCQIVPINANNNYVYQNPS